MVGRGLVFSSFGNSSKCFQKAGILSDEMDVVTVGYDDDNDDPFLECDVRGDSNSY